MTKPVEKEGSMNDDDAVRIAGAFLLGGAIGAFIALLYAPKSGKETRKSITKAARRVKEDAVEMVEDTIESVNDFVNDVKDRATDIIDRGVELSDSAKKEIVHTLEYGQKSIDKQKKRIKQSLGF